MSYFGNLICFVKDCEIIIEKDNINQLKPYESNLFSNFKLKSNVWQIWNKSSTFVWNMLIFSYFKTLTCGMIAAR